jgi:hypothetical protein
LAGHRIVRALWIGAVLLRLMLAAGLAGDHGRRGDRGPILATMPWKPTACPVAALTQLFLVGSHFRLCPPAVAQSGWFRFCCASPDGAGISLGVGGGGGVTIPTCGGGGAGGGIAAV